MNTLTLLTAETSHGRDLARRLGDLSRKLDSVSFRKLVWAI
jgi:hypothetical protein